MTNTILCSAGKGEMSVNACLHCSLSSGHPPCGYEYGLLSTLFAVEFGDSRDGIHVTDLTGCLKKAYFKKTENAPEYVHEMMARFLGTLFHGNLEDAGEAENELKLEAMGIVGRADRVYKTVGLWTGRRPAGCPPASCPTAPTSFRSISTLICCARWGVRWTAWRSSTST